MQPTPEDSPLRRARLAAGFSLNTAGRALDIAPSTLSRFEAGRPRRGMRSELLARVAKLYGTTVDRLLGHDVPVTPSELAHEVAALAREVQEIAERMAVLAKRAGVGL